MFVSQYLCQSVEALQTGGKIVLPNSALASLIDIEVDFPMLFKLSNLVENRSTHVGVLEFTAEEGKIYLPPWMTEMLKLQEGGLVRVESATLPIATFVRMQPQCQDFLDIPNPKAVLETYLRNFGCISTGDLILVHFNNKIFKIKILETKPDVAVSIVTDCNVNLDFVEPDCKAQVEQPMEEDEPELDISQLLPEREGFIAFGGSCNRLGGKKKGTTNSEQEIESKQLAEYTRGIPQNNFQNGNLQFIRAKPKPKEDNKENGSDFEAFKGTGQSLRQAKK